MEKKKKCTKCNKLYIAKRLGGQFCSSSCANGFRQQIKRDALVRIALVEKGYVAQEKVSSGEGEMSAWIKALAERAGKLIADRAGSEAHQSGLKERVSSFLNDIALEGAKIAGDSDKRYLMQEEAAERMKARKLQYIEMSHKKKLKKEKEALEAFNIDNLLSREKIQEDKDLHISKQDGGVEGGEMESINKELEPTYRGEGVD